jgi:hypothetical protein
LIFSLIRIGFAAFGAVDGTERLPEDCESRYGIVNVFIAAPALLLFSLLAVILGFMIGLRVDVTAEVMLAPHSFEPFMFRDCRDLDRPMEGLDERRGRRG